MHVNYIICLSKSLGCFTWAGTNQFFDSPPPLLAFSLLSAFTPYDAWGRALPLAQSWQEDLAQLSLQNQLASAYYNRKMVQIFSIAKSNFEGTMLLI